MSALPAVGPITEEQYLSDPAFEHCEYVNGIVVERNVGGKPHSRIQANCCGFIWSYLRTNRIGYVVTELTCRLTVGGYSRFRLPDVAVVLGDESTEQRYLERSPDLVVEVRSPDDSLTSQLRKLDDYFENGCRLAWLVLPEERSVLILAPGAAPRTATAGETLDGGDVLPGLNIAVDDLFA
ncbi:MAG: Uma2 family endonuclease, partial [Acidobacteria bacterium]|nr:Uma2 family endonuclease [Acidobacteriota bacterium]